MSSSQSSEILCPSCGQETLLLREPTYDGFTRVGEKLSCTSCGHVFESEEEVPFKEKRELKVFTEADRPEAVDVFEEGEADRLCRYCTHYVVNPFMQWCGQHKKEVEATDTCARFEKREEEEPESEEEEKPPIL